MSEEHRRRLRTLAELIADDLDGWDPEDEVTQLRFWGHFFALRELCNTIDRDLGNFDHLYDVGQQEGRL